MTQTLSTEAILEAALLVSDGPLTLKQLQGLFDEHQKHSV